MSELQGASQVSRRCEKYILYDVCRKAVAEFEFADLWTCQSFDALELLDPWIVRLSRSSDHAEVLCIFIFQDSKTSFFNSSSKTSFNFLRIYENLNILNI